MLAQVQVAASGRLGVMACVKVAATLFPGGAGQGGDGHAAPLAKTRLPAGGLDPLLGRIGAQLPLLGILAPLVEQGHVEKAALVLHPAEKIRPVQPLVIEPFAQVHPVDVTTCRQEFPALEQGPDHHGGLLGIEVVGVGEVTQVLAHVAAGVEPAAMYVPALIGAKESCPAVRPVEGAAGALSLEVVDDIGEAAARQQPPADGKGGGAHQALLRFRGHDGLQPVVAGLGEGGEIGPPVVAPLPAGDAPRRHQRRLQQKVVVLLAQQPDVAADIEVGAALQQGALLPVTFVTHLVDQKFHQGLTPKARPWRARLIAGPCGPDARHGRATAPGRGPAYPCSWR